MKRKLIPRQNQQIELFDSQINVRKILEEYEAETGKYNQAWSTKFLKSFNRVRKHENSKKDE